jgi:hypothetical protein
MKKNKILLCMALMLPCFVFAQDIEIPKREFVVEASSREAVVTRGKSESLKLTVRRSKQYRNSNAALSVGSSLPPGVTLQYEVQEGLLQQSDVTITATDKAAPGEYRVILNCTMNYKTKGVIVKLKVL